MKSTAPTILTRPAEDRDLPGLCEILNEIIALGGTTAMEDPLSQDEFRAHFLEGPRHICCTVAVGPDHQVLGFQALERYPGLPEDWGDIATFTRRSDPVPGVGSKLFPATLAHARAHKVVAINATIRADNQGGLAYYSKMGFEDYALDKAVPLKNGQLVDRISKRFSLS
ncbi:N-acetyltransferase family protein [Rhodovibrionaceae bacterium A322]